MDSIAKKYIHEETTHDLESPKVIVPNLLEIFDPYAVVDVGCGLGTFLRVFIENGANEVLVRTIRLNG